MSYLKKMKKGKGQASPSPLDKNLLIAWNSGFSAGAKEQREADVEYLVKLLSELEQVSGIGEKTAEKIRIHMLGKFQG